MRVFISHSSNNSELSAEVCAKIEEAGHNCFLAPRNIRSGHEYAEEIINGIDDSDVVLLLLSQSANDSPHVLREIERAVSKKKPVIVYKLEEVTLSKSMEYFLMTHQWLSSNGDKDFDEIIRRIDEYAAAHVGNSSQTPQEIPPLTSNTENAPMETPAKKTVNSSQRRNIIIIAAAAVILVASGIVTGFCLANRAPINSSQPEAPSPIEVQGEPAPDKQSSIPPQEELHPQNEPAPQDVQNGEPAAKPQIDSSPQNTEPSPQQNEPPVEVILPATQQTTQKPQDTTVPPETTPVPQETPSEPEMTAAKAELGDSLMLGSYNGEPIKWRVIQVSEDGTQAVVITDDIITMKAYDAAEGGEFNKYNGEDYWNKKPEDISPDVQRQIRGDNRWEFSNIRTWLNSDRENVVYSGQAPTSQAMTEKRNGYHTEAGFLNSFTKAERSAIVETQLTTNGAATSDKVFLLSSDELEWLYEADVSVFAEPTAAAVEQDKSEWYKVDSSVYDVDDFFWWLRDANPDNACECFYINLSCSDQRVASGSVGLEGYGIRPAMTLDLTSDIVKTALESAHDTD